MAQTKIISIINFYRELRVQIPLLLDVVVVVVLFLKKEIYPSIQQPSKELTKTAKQVHPFLFFIIFFKAPCKP